MHRRRSATTMRSTPSNCLVVRHTESWQPTLHLYDIDWGAFCKSPVLATLSNTNNHLAASRTFQAARVIDRIGAEHSAGQVRGIVGYELLCRSPLLSGRPLQLGTRRVGAEALSDVKRHRSLWSKVTWLRTCKSGTRFIRYQATQDRMQWMFVNSWTGSKRLWVRVCRIVFVRFRSETLTVQVWLQSLHWPARVPRKAPQISYLLKEEQKLYEGGNRFRCCVYEAWKTIYKVWIQLCKKRRVGRSRTLCIGLKLRRQKVRNWPHRMTSAKRHKKIRHCRYLGRAWRSCGRRTANLISWSLQDENNGKNKKEFRWKQKRLCIETSRRLAVVTSITLRKCPITVGLTIGANNIGILQQYFKIGFIDHQT